MPGISRLTALEIFTNLNDLEITIEQEKGEGEKFAIGISRGPGHNFKPMLTSRPFAETLEAAVEAIKETLEGVRQAVSKEFEDPASIATRYLNPERGEVDPAKILSMDLIDRIVGELRSNRKASTYQMFAVTS
jgi:hypothetical protein